MKDLFEERDANWRQDGFVQIPCQVWEGIHADEVGVLIQTEGKKIISFINKRDVEVEKDPTSESFVDGWLNVFVVDGFEDFLLVDLPDENFSESTFRIPKEMIRRRH